MTRISILILFISILIFSCSDDGSVSDVNIDPEIQPYVDRFLAEAAQRGINIDLEESGLDIRFEIDISTADYAGVCRFRLGSNEIGIDRERWDASSERRKEWLIYHELGHCVLDRDHRNDRFDNGMWKSLMRGDPLTQEELRVPLCYLWERNQYYIDELFDETTVAPEWVNNSFNYNDTPERGEEIYTLESTEDRFNKILPTGYENFELEFTYRRKGGGSNINMLYGGTGSLEFNFVSIDVNANEVLLGDHELSCYRLPFEGVIDNKITIRQINGTTSIFANEDFIHAFPAYELPVERIRTTGNAQVEVKDLHFWTFR